ncbi:hypothetical protein [Bifidobacterium castoris]|uniref:Phage portal protein gp6 n=1 Tax=Bifidobacterium castoris TaxID=2306972 RepID=A0A430F4F9_9BIFI|nr:hypothetical protein [Bifidobacterium castoris]RSX44692.1 Phage portal protein gp6 [Bifidobacterium castoris]
MVDFGSLIADDNESLDAYWLTVLAKRLEARIPKLCKLRTFYDGAEFVPTNAIPSGVDQTSYEIYRRFLELGTVNYARVIADNVSTRQKPIGFRQVSDRAVRSVEADTAWADNHMDLKARQMFHDVSIYGSGYLLVTQFAYPQRIKVLTPWETWVEDEAEAAVWYTYSEFEGREYLQLFRCERDDSGVLKRVYSRTASRESDRRTLLAESDTENIYKVCNDPETKLNTLSSDFHWDDGTEECSFGLACGGLPLVRLGSGTGMGVYEPHLPMLASLDQERFDRFCIQTMQAFRQRAIRGMKRAVYTENDIQVVNGQKKAGDPVDLSDAFAMGPAALWLLPEGCEIWESQVTDIQQWVTASSADVKQLAAATGTPLDVLSPDVSGSAEGAQLKRETLVMRVEDLNARANDALVRAMRMAMVAAGNESAAAERFETVWAPIAPNSELSEAQTASFLKDVLPPKTIMRQYLHMTETEISEAMQDMADNTYQNAFTTASAATDAAAQASENTGGFVRVDDSEDGVKALVDVDGDTGGDVDG